MLQGELGRTSSGLIAADIWAFEQLLIKANEEQLFSLQQRLTYEIQRRIQ